MIPEDGGIREGFPETAMGRATASSRIDGNALHLQFEGPTAFDTWIEAIEGAERYVHFENYILRDDSVGRRFRDALVERALAGIQVRLIHDWMGCWATPNRFWRPFREAGVEVRAFNRPSFRDPFGLLQRDHRKLVVVDGEVAFLGGFCVGEAWVGTRTEPPWRDTGVEIRGPAAAHAARTFERVWAEMGSPVPTEICADPAKVVPRGESAVWLIEGVPWRSRVYRATQLTASFARRRIWITDPYFVAPRTVAESLTAAARDGVDVRILVPRHNNWPWVGSLSRAGYRGLLEAGVRLFEWEGPMIHAKTAVVDGVWARIGSTNLNAASLLGNWELDVGVLDEDFARQVEGLFLADLASAVEIVLPPWRGAEQALPSRTRTDALDPVTGLPARLASLSRTPGAQTLTLADLLRVGTSLGEAIAGRRLLGREDRTALGTVTFLILILALVAGFFPRPVGWTVALAAGWVGSVLAIRGMGQWWRARRTASETTDSTMEPEGLHPISKKPEGRNDDG